MHDILRRLRGVLIAVTALALSASLTFGAQAPAASRGLATTVTQAEEGASGSGDEAETPEDETDESSDGGDNCATDPRGLTEEELAALSHGSIVCWAAHQETPEGYKNHGAWVSQWAKGDHGSQNADSPKGNGHANGHSQD